MSEIRHISIRNFRSLRNFAWYPKQGLNCIIGPGDSGKSTILDAIDLALGARRSFPFSDADFFKMDTSNPIEIYISIGALSDDLKTIDSYGWFLRGFDNVNLLFYDEPTQGCETILTIKLIVDENLDPDWQLYSDRALKEGIERRLLWKHRELIAPARLGTATQQHFAWGRNSVLNKFSEASLDVSGMLASISRQTRQAFADNEIENVSGVLSDVKGIANSLGVQVGELKALLDVNGVSLSYGAISLHNEDSTPLRQLGTGSSRLLISGLQKAKSVSKTFLVDEAEYGLEPFRITRLLNELGSKDATPSKQVFITTHSPYVLRELQASQLHVIQKKDIATPPVTDQLSHSINSLQNNDFEQATLRVCAEAFFNTAVIVAEGKTEIGLIRGIDLYAQDTGRPTIQSQGIYYADGGGDTTFARAQIFKSLGYNTVILKDSDLSENEEHQKQAKAAQALGIQIFEWGDKLATENALFLYCPADKISEILNIAVDWKNWDAINAHILNFSNNQYGLAECLGNFSEPMRVTLGNAAKQYSWFKDIEPAEKLARTIIGPQHTRFSNRFTSVLKNFFSWMDTGV